MPRKSRVRVDVGRSLADQPLNTEEAARRLEGSRAVHNVQPAGFLLGILGALFSILFALYAAQRASSKQAERETGEPPPPPPTAAPRSSGDEIWIELE